MDFDAAAHLAAVERSTSLLERDGRPARTVTLARSFATTVDDLWDAVTNAERIPRWFAPVSGQLELGGHYQIEGNAGGTITACRRPSSFALTWEFGGQVSWVEVRLADDGAGGARLTLEHTSHRAPPFDQFGPGATGVGWEMALGGLALHLARPDRGEAGRGRLRRLAGGQGVHHRQQRGVGAGGSRGRRGSRRRAGGGAAHGRVLHGRGGRVGRAG